MVKLLRKHRKYILVVGGTLLMIAFLVPQAFNTLIGDPGRRVYAKLGGEKITLTEHERFQREFSALDEFSPGLVRGELRCESADHWMLLSREATDAGLVAEDGDGSSWTEFNSAMETAAAAQIAQSLYGAQAREKLADPAVQKQCMDLAKRRVEDQKAETAARNRLTPADFNKSLARARGVFRLRNAFLSAPRYSDRRAVAVKAQRFEGAVIESLVVPAERIAFTMPEPAEEQLVAHFAKYRDVKPGDGEMGFGYRLNPRVKLEWITIDRAAIEKAVPTDAVEANKRWRNNRAKFPGEFAAEQSRIEAEIKKERVEKIAADVDVLVRGEFKRAASRLEADGTFKKLPPDWASRRPKLEDVAQTVVKSVKENSGIDIPMPTVTVQSAKWLTELDLYSLPGLGSASVSLGGGSSVPLPGLVFAAKEFNRTDLADFNIALQVGLTSGDLVGVDASSRYYFTILDFRGESPADSIDEVRDRCVLDLKKLAAFERLKASLPVYEALALGGLDEVKKTVDAEYPLPVAPTDTPDPALPDPALPDPAKPGDKPAVPEALEITRRQFVPRVVTGSTGPTDSPEFRAKVRAIAQSLDPTKPTTEKPAEERVASIANPRSLAVQVALVVGIQPATFEVIRAMGDRQLEETQLREIRQLMDADPTLDPYRYDTLVSRWKYSLENLSDTTPIRMPTRKAK